MNIISSFVSRNLLNTSSFSGFIEPIVQLISPDTRLETPASKVTRVSWNNKNTYTISIIPNRKWQGFQAGQFVQLTVEKDGAYLTRCFSISSSPQKFERSREIDLTIRSHKKGLLTPWIGKSLRAGSRVYLSQAQGEFTLAPSDRKRLFIAGGSGITPIMSMLKDKQTESQLSDAVLLFYVRSSSDRFFISELKELQNLGLQYQVIYTSSHGRFTYAHLEQYCSDFMHRDVYVCGPNDMIESVKQTCTNNGVQESNLFYEYFGLNNSPSSADDIEDKVISVEYQLSQKQSQTQGSNENRTLLEMAENEGLKPTYGCRMGVCHQCICKKKQGRVFNIKTKQVSDTGEEEIQLCLSKPIENVTLEL